MSFSLAHLDMLYYWVLAPASPPSSLSQVLRLLARNHSSSLKAPSFLSWRWCRGSSMESLGPVLFRGPMFP